MAEIKIYSKNTCPACVMAKNIFKQKQVEFEEIILDNKPEQLKELIAKTGMKTVPQIFINKELIGGCSDLMRLEQQKKLDPMLKA